MPAESFYNIDSDPDNAKRIRKERDKARELKRTPWWKNQLHEYRGLIDIGGHSVADTPTPITTSSINRIL